MPITLNEDVTFLICDELGDVPPGAEFGLYCHDSRFVSAYGLTLDGLPPLPLTSRATGHNTATHVLTNPALPGLPRGQLGIVRQRFVGLGMHEDIDITNHGAQEAAFRLALRLSADFAHVFEVKRGLEVKEEVLRQAAAVRAEVLEGGTRLRLRYEHGDSLRQLVVELTARPIPARSGPRTACGSRLASAGTCV